MPFCYIIYSSKLKRFYTGACINLQERIDAHNTAKYGPSKYSSKANDWTLFLDIQVDSYDHALRIERKIKAMKSAVYKQNLKKYPEMVQRLIHETQQKLS
jgi:putative endonuclease